MATHTDIRAAVVTLIEGLSLRVSPSTDALDMMATEQGAHVVAVLVADAPGDQWGGTRAFVVELSAAAGRGCNEAAARALLSTLAASLRGAMLTPGALASASATVPAAEVESIERAGDVVVLRHRYEIMAIA
jgi:hypothetical protein